VNESRELAMRGGQHPPAPGVMGAEKGEKPRPLPLRPKGREI
jgi:hypothetical protein